MKPYLSEPGLTIYNADVLESLREMPDASVHCCVTSPPYWCLRDYGVAGQIGLEPTPEAYVAKLVEVFREVRRVLRDDGTLWLNLGDSYASTPPGNKTKGVSSSSTLHGVNGPSGKTRDTLSRSVQTKRNTLVGSLKPKDLVGIPWRVAFALQADGWYLRSDIIWSKPNPMPESVTDRPTKAHEYLFLLAKSEKYYYDAEAIKEPQTQGSLERWKAGDTRDAGPKAHDSPNGLLIRDQATWIGLLPNGRNKRSVWTIATEPFPEAHFATFPQALIEPCIKAGCPAGGTVLDPFGGSGTTALVARRMGCSAVLIELSPEYAAMAARRVSQATLEFSEPRP